MIYKFESLDSTNNYLKSNYKKLNNFDICQSSFQTYGKGRNNHVWDSKAGENLLFSILIKDKNIIRNIESLTLKVGVSVFKYLSKFKLLNLSIKWPNDVYVNDKKICGILCESICEGENIKALIIGIGLNINQIEFKDLNATSIYKEINIKQNIDYCLKELFEIVKDDLLNSNDYLDILNNHNYLYKKKCFVYFHNKKEVAIILDINKDNSINCIIGGNKQKISVNEITLIK